MCGCFFSFCSYSDSRVDMVCDLGLSVSDFEVDESQALSNSKKKCGVSHIGTRGAQESESKHGNDTRASRRPRGHQSNQFLNDGMHGNASSSSQRRSLDEDEIFHVGMTEVKHFLLSPEDDAISILSFVGNVCDEGDAKSSQCWRQSEAL